MQIIGNQQLSQSLNTLAQQAPYAAAQALTTTAFTAQKEVKQQLPQWVHLNKPFLQQQVLVEKATKQSPIATVGFSNKVPLAMLFEEGGTRKPTRGSALAVPVDIKRNNKGLIPFSQRPRQLMGKKGIVASTIDGIGGIWKATKRVPLTLLYIFKRTVTYRRKYFHFHDTVKKVATRDMQKNLIDQLKQAVARAKSRP